MSDLTDEEIIATRRLNGLNDDLFKIDKKINKQENIGFLYKISQKPLLFKIIYAIIYK